MVKLISMPHDSGVKFVIINNNRLYLLKLEFQLFRLSSHVPLLRLFANVSIAAAAIIIVVVKTMVSSCCLHPVEWPNNRLCFILLPCISSFLIIASSLPIVYLLRF